MKRFILISLVTILLFSCSTTTPSGKTMNILPLDISRSDFEIVSEDNYSKTMSEEVEPYLN